MKTLSLYQPVRSFARESLDKFAEAVSAILTVAREAFHFLIATMNENPTTRLSMMGDSVRLWQTTERTGVMEEGEVPVHFLHGFLGNARLWRKAQEKFYEKNFHHLTARTRNTFKCIKQQAEEEWYEIEKILKKTGKKQIDLVGHSQGGLVALCIAKKHPDKVRSVICLGSPVQGTEHAIHSHKLLKWLGFGVAAEQMSSESTFINELKKWLRKEAIINPTKFLFISSMKDQIIKPSSYSLPEQLQKTDTFENEGDLYKFIVNNKRHVELKYDEGILNIAIHWLKNTVNGSSSE